MTLFEAAMLETYDTAKAACGYNATRFIQMVHEQGGLATAKRLLVGSDVSYGLMQLWEYGRLDLSVEAQVLRTEFRELFGEQELAEAKRRLIKLEYVPPWLAE